MKKYNDYFIRNDRHEQFATMADTLAKQFAKRAAKHDEERSFPFENFEDLKEAGYLKATVPRQFGGEGATLYEMILMQERIARGDGSTALAVGWHMGLMIYLRTNNIWPKDVYESFCRKVVEQGEMINNFTSEPNSGSPTRGGLPQTIAEKTSGGWLITGHKTFSTLSPILNYFVVRATIQGEDRIGRFLVRKSENVRIEETWNTMSMRASGSHDVILDQVFVPENALVEVEIPNKKTHQKHDQGWLLHIPACYIGIAHGARDIAIQYALKYQPNSLSTPIIEIPHIQQKIGEMEAELKTARTVLYSVAKRWDEDPERRSELRPELGLAKYVATNSAISIVDKAMRIVGGPSLFKAMPLERMYRDVRAGLHNPPMDDSVLKGLTDAAIQSVSKGR